jgi:DNA-directed RNA polymerase specialized sigma24 family protein
MDTPLLDYRDSKPSLYATRGTSQPHPAADDPAWPVFLSELREFSGTTASARPIEELSAREREVMRLVAEGLSNEQIAERLSSAYAPSSGTSRTCT